MKVTREQLEMMPYKTLMRWARNVRGYVFNNDCRKPEMIERILRFEAERERTA